LSNGQQLVSTASDGLVKLWNIREEECIKTLDGHEDKVSIAEARSAAALTFRRSGRSR
jgi:WD40 repeat protein